MFALEIVRGCGAVLSAAAAGGRAERERARERARKQERVQARGLGVLPLALLLIGNYSGGTEASEPVALAPVLGPVLIQEPPTQVAVGPAGARLQCVARGDPAPRISWLSDDGTPLLDGPGTWRVLDDGSLQVTRAHGPQAVRCRAASPRGAVVSRLVVLLPALEGARETAVDAPPVWAGGVATLRCRTPGSAVVWYRDGRTLDTSEPRYLAAGELLLIRDAAPADAAGYSCAPLAAAARRSAPAALRVLPRGAGAAGGGGAPRLPLGAGGSGGAAEVRAARGERFCLACAAADYPVPHYTWYRERDGRLEPVQLVAGGSTGPGAEGVVGVGSVRAWAGGAALCGRAGAELAGAWLCKAYNGYGDSTMQLRLHVDEDFDVVVAPALVVAEVGSTVRLNCSTSSPAALSWLHDGESLAAGSTDATMGGSVGGAAGGSSSRLVLRAVTRAHRGMYQCMATRGASVAHSVAELRLADSAPELQYTFIEQALRAGGAAALRCTASASPPPRIAWLLDGQPLDRFLPRHRYRVTEEASPPDQLTSLLNVSVTAADGGRYACRAHNALGVLEHSARLNVYGPLAVRAVGPVRAVAGDNITLHCPYSGYPISSVWWRRGGAGGGDAGAEVPAARRMSARDGALQLRSVQARDAGRYACGVNAPGGAAAAGELELQVRNPPKISPFMFSSELTEGSAVQVLCGVSSGDKPVYFSWLKDGASIPADLQVEEKSLNEFSLLMFGELTARHSGAYTCRVSNHAAVANYTAVLSVRVAPSWVREPLDAAVLLGAPLQLECAARGHPAPTIAWYRRTGDVNLRNVDGRVEGTKAESSEWGDLAPDAGESGGVVTARMRVRSATRELQGAYRCSVDNGVGAPLFKQVNVTVHEPAQLTGAGGATRNASGVRGAPVELECEARGDAPLALRWTHRGRTLEHESFKWIISETRSGGVSEAAAAGAAGVGAEERVRSVLRLRAAGRADAGEYRCLAHNRFGRSERTLFLHVEEPPEAPQSVQLAGSSSRWIRVRWRARSGPGVQYYAQCAPLHALPGSGDAAHLLNLTLETGDDEGPDLQGYRPLSATVRGVRPAAAYSLRLLAANRVGSSSPSAPLLLTTLEEAPSGSPQDVHVKPVNTEELLVSWSAPAQNTWNGDLLGYAVSWRELSRIEEERREGTEGAGVRSGHDVARGWSSGELLVRGLREFTRYAVTVRAYNAAGAGPHSPAAHATTADGVPDAPPSGVSCAAEGARSLRVRWVPPRAADLALRGFDVLYAPVHDAPTWGGAGAEMSLGDLGGEARGALMTALRAGTNYTVRVRARSARGHGPASPPVCCATREDVPGAVQTVRAVAVSHEAVRVSWLPPAEPAARLTHYTLHVRELGKSGGEWSQRVDIMRGAESAEGQEGDGDTECSTVVAGLRARAAFEFRVRAQAASGAGPASRAAAAATAPPDQPVSARIWSLARAVGARAGGRVRLRCGAAGTPPLVRRWAPLPRAHTLTDDGDLILHNVESDGNFTCSVRNAAGADRVVVSVRVRRALFAPALRLLRADTHALHLAWDAPHATPADPVDPVIGYSVWWRRLWADAAGAAAQSVRTSRRELALRGLACGARYSVWVRAHNALGASPPSHTLTLRTKGDKAKAPPANELIWANSTALRLNLLAWGGRCAVERWELVVARAAVPTDGETATANNLEPGTWHEVRVTATSPAGDTTARYRAATLTLDGERVGPPSELPLAAGASAPEGAGGGGRASGGAGWRGAWRGAASAGLCAAALALLAAGAALAGARMRRTTRRAPHHHIEKLPPPEAGTDELQEISPYATFSMSSSATGGARSCALHVHSPATEAPLAAPAPRASAAVAHCTEYGSGSESSGSPCAACAAELYRVPAARLADTLPAAEWGVEDKRSERRVTRSGRVQGEERGDGRERARRRVTRHEHAHPARYPPATTLPSHCT